MRLFHCTCCHDLYEPVYGITWEDADACGVCAPCNADICNCHEWLAAAEGTVLCGCGFDRPA